MAQDALDLMARPAEQQSTIRLVAQPSSQAAAAPISYVPEAWIDFADPAVAEKPRRTLGRVRMPLRALLLVILGLLLFAVWFVGLDMSGVRSHLSQLWYFLILLAVTELIAVVIWVLLPRWILRRHDAGEAIRWRRPQRSDWYLAVLALIVMVAIWIAFTLIADEAGWWWAVRADPPEGWTAFPNWWVAAAFAFAAVIMAPYVEETLFRGFMVGGLTHVWWVVPSVLLSAALFAAAHRDLTVMIPFALFGIVFSVLYLRSRHLTAPAIAHAGWNLGVTVLLLLEYGVG